MPVRHGIRLLQNPGMQCDVNLMHPSKEFRRVEVTRPTPIVQVDESPTSSQPEQVTSMTVHRSYLSSRKAKPSVNSC